MTRAWYIIREIAAGIAHMEQSHPAWRNRRRFINAVFFWQDDHCKDAWETDYARAIASVKAQYPYPEGEA